MQKSILSRAICGLALSGIAGSITTATAGVLEEVTVTAQHREQDIQDVPISITAMGSEQLKKADIFDANGIAKNVPGMAYAEFSPGQAIISVRGISSVDDGAGLDNSTAIFLDGVYIGRLAAVNFDMFDMERIEVLRGPQGTLFGRNSIGGAINVVSSKPTDELSAKLGVTVGNEGIQRYQGYLSGGLTDSLAGKIVLNHRQHDGFGRNVLLGNETQDQDQTSVRAQLLLSLASSEWLLSADAMQDERKDMGRTPIANGNFDYLSVLDQLGGGVHKSAAPIEGFSDREASGISLQGDIGIGNGTLTTITAFRTAEADWEMPSIGAPAGGGFDFGDPDDPFDDVFGVDVNDDIVEDIETFSQELRWTSSLSDTFDYTIGGYFFLEDTDRVEE
ncbi:MAG: TonB-dependent receptor plug domain-containing protein, partial [Gammaproteobacteria bacterium]